MGYTSAMSVRKVISLRLEAEEYDRLEAEARRLGIAPGVLARLYVRERLNGDRPRQELRRVGQAALDRLAELTSDLPPIDAVRVAREGRDDLEGRPLL